MGEELGRWLDAAKPAWPWALGGMALVLIGYAVHAWLDRQKLALMRQLAREAVEAEKRTRHLQRHIDCVVEPTQAIDMSVLTAHPDKARFDPRRVLVRMRERRAVGEEFVPPADWTDEDLKAVKSMTDRDGWPNTTYQRRGFLPRLGIRRQPRVVTPKELAKRIAAIRAEKQKQTEVPKAVKP